MDNQDNSWNEVVSPTIEVAADQIEKIRTEPVKIELTAEAIVKKYKIKRYSIIGGFSLLILIILLAVIFRPKDPTPIYDKYEEFGPCLSSKEQCFQSLTIYPAGKVVFGGKIKNESKISPQKLKEIKNLISNSKLMSANCKETQILMEYKVTHKLFLDNTLKEIKSPGCESEIETLDLAVENIIK